MEVFLKCEPQNHLASRGMDNEKILFDLGYTKKDIKKLYLKNILSEGYLVIKKLSYLFLKKENNSSSILHLTFACDAPSSYSKYTKLHD